MTIRAPEKLLDLSIPSDIPLADLLPVVVSQAGEQLPEEGLESGGWVLQRIGGDPLDPEGTADTHGLRDGEVLLLRAQSAALAGIRFDNLVDAVSSAVRDLPHPWMPSTARWTLRLMTFAVLVACVVVLALPGDVLSRVALAAGSALLALVGARVAARTMEDVPGGVLMGLASCLLMGLVGALLTDGPGDVAATPVRAGAHLLAGGAAAGVGAALAAAVVSDCAVVFASVAVVCAAGVLGGALMIALDAPFSAVAGSVAVTAVVFGAFVPRLSFSLSGLRLPPLPTTPEQLQEGIEPHAEEGIVSRAADTDRWMSGFYVSAAVVCSLSMFGMARRPELPQLVTCVLLALLLFLHGRSLGTSWQRLALSAAALLGPLAAAVELAGHRGTEARLAVAAVLLLCATGLALAAWNVPGRRLLPHWGRVGDLAQSAAAFALLPSALWCLGIYQMLRSANG
ncbi:type VII secretion integral membrane protein EccD [Streptomyces misionensis]|uniref:type VII secretion integral membrane protein EccD n=1 Tax=Streptomyces misionensis TaxID=67331 RepID=UPI0036AC9B79